MDVETWRLSNFPISWSLWSCSRQDRTQSQWAPTCLHPRSQICLYWPVTKTIDRTEPGRLALNAEHTKLQWQESTWGTTINLAWVFVGVGGSRSCWIGDRKPWARHYRALCRPISPLILCCYVMSMRDFDPDLLDSVSKSPEFFPGPLVNGNSTYCSLYPPMAQVLRFSCHPPQTARVQVLCLVFSSMVALGQNPEAIGSPI